eukprot:symbB.v1.2.030093.t1/scaffold3348.1/size58710/3
MNFYVFYETDLVEYESECAGQCVTTPDAELESAHWGAPGPCSWLTGTVAFATSLDPRIAWHFDCSRCHVFLLWCLAPHGGCTEARSPRPGRGQH